MRNKAKFLKNETIKSALCFCFAAFAFLFCSCSLFYDYDKVGAFGIGYSKIEKNAFVADFDYVFGGENRIVLPSEYKGIKIKTLGGYFGRGVPSPFGVSINDDEINAGAKERYVTEESYLYDENLGWWDEVEIINCELTVVLPEYLEKIEFIRLSEIFVGEYELKNGKIKAKVVRPSFCFSISENNEYFYTLNGKIYNKKDNSLINGIVYGENSAK